MSVDRVQIIAEAGVNHNGSLGRALEMIDRAADAGVDAVKFQTFRAEAVVSRDAPKAEYQARATGSAESQLDMVRALELDADAHRALAERCRARGVTFLSTPFDAASVALLVSLGVPLLKVPSGEVTNPLLLRAVAATGLPLIMSTGMCTLGEVEQALAELAAVWLDGAGVATAPAAAWASAAGRAEVRARVTLLHCTTEYPAPFDDVNLRAMTTLGAAFGLPVGYSDHTEGIAVSLAAAALGACVIEKHFTLDRGLPGPDHRASLEPRELAELVAGVRAVERALGDGIKRPMPSEAKNLPIARRSLVAACAIARGSRFTRDNLTAKRPATGVPALRLDEYLGRVSTRDYAADELIDP